MKKGHEKGGFQPEPPCINISCQSSCLVVAPTSACIYCNRRLGSAAAGLRESTGPSPACVIEAFPVSVAEAFPICPASLTCTDVTSAATAAAAVIAAAAATAAVIAATAAAVVIAASTAAAAVIATTASTIVITAAAATADISTTKSTTATITSTSTSKSKTTHISHLLFYWFVLYHMGQSDKVLLIVSGDYSVTVLWEPHKLLIKKS